MQRIILKVGSSSLTNQVGRLEFSKILQVVEQIIELRLQGKEVLLVSSGAIAAGTERLGWNRSNLSVPEKQAAAAVGQAKVIENYTKLLEEFGYLGAQILLTREDMDDAGRKFHLGNTIEVLLTGGVIPIFNENDSVAVEEIRFGENDQLAAMIAVLVHADCLLLLTDIDGLYSDNPADNPAAVRIPVVETITDEIMKTAGNSGSLVGTGGMRSKLEAAKFATAHGVEVRILPALERGVAVKSLTGEDIGTRFLIHPSAHKRSRVN
ncbi:MAG: glutamate 5-kinase [Bacilli bacterium]|nr:glutamate 5-kinase [Bacilli bacterium]